MSIEMILKKTHNDIKCHLKYDSKITDGLLLLWKCGVMQEP